jgi:uncharacterized membrane protein (UPF0136 family)
MVPAGVSFFLNAIGGVIYFLRKNCKNYILQGVMVWFG